MSMTRLPVVPCRSLGSLAGSRKQQYRYIMYAKLHGEKFFDQAMGVNPHQPPPRYATAHQPFFFSENYRLNDLSYGI